MTRDDTEELLIQIQKVWKTVDTSPIAVKVWHSALADISLDDAERALAAYLRGITGDDYPPKPGDLIRMVSRAHLSLPSEDEAWMMVIAEARRAGLGRSVFHDGVSYPIRPSIPIVEVALAAESVGWRQIVMEGEGREGTFIKRSFHEAYRRFCDKTREALVLMGAEDFAYWRRGMANRLQIIRLGNPQTLYELGAPEAYAAIADGSGPATAALPARTDPEPTFRLSPEETEQRRVDIAARVINLGDRMRAPMLGPQATPRRSALDLRKKVGDE